MITICVMPAFKGTKKEFFQSLCICLTLDSFYIVPLLF